MGLHSRHTIDADVVPRFTASYLRVAGDTCAFIEAHTQHALPRLLGALKEHDLSPDQVQYVVLTHAHLDHAAGASALLAACPNATLLAHPRTAKHMIDPDKLIAGAKAVYGEARFRDLYGEIAPIPGTRVRSLEDGDSFDLGGAKLTAWHTYGHAFHHAVIDDPATETVYAGDTFGLVYPALQHGGRFAFPSTSPTGFHAAEANKSLDKVLSLGERFVCPTHFDAYSDARLIAAQVRRFVDRAGAWVDEAARGDATEEALERRFADLFREAIREEAPHFGEAELALLALDVEINARGLAHVAIAARGA